GYPPRYNPEVLKKLKANPPDIFICGHSHILKILHDPKINNLLHINPGAAGVHGFHKIRTLVRFDITDNKISEMQVIELGKRSV
ncbi:MAG: metallophosphatase family protein, partial [Bacteroidota bacterium]|nr:metallophosphatase family protein [Bacteroidota bacterium]